MLEKERFILENLKKKKIVEIMGKVHTVQEHLIISKGPKCKIGDICLVGEKQIMHEVIAIEKTNVFLLPYSNEEKVNFGDYVVKTDTEVKIPSSEEILGKVLDGNGETIDNINVSSENKTSINLESKRLKAFEREEINERFETGIKAIDGLLTIGEGQKIGIFASAGVGKSTLLGMIAKSSEADVNVLVLVGERGREVKEFINKELGSEGLKKSVLVVATSDESPLMLIRAAKLGTSIAEKFRNEGKKVLLMMDSLTRFVVARRDLDIASEEYPIAGKTLLMETYAKKLLERAGKTKIGSITGIYTVLVEGDDMEGPIPDMVKGILDGHIVLSKKLVSNNHYPAIDVLNSISRVMESVVEEEHLKVANNLRKYLSLYYENEHFFKIGEMVENEETKEIFKARKLFPHINEFLRQERREFFTLDVTLEKLIKTINI